MPKAPTIELVAIGDELLNGLRSNGHLVFLGEQLSQRGLELAFACEVRDEPKDMEETLSIAVQRSDIVITTGGLGPTEDDLTVETVAKVLGKPLLMDPAIESGIREFFRKRHREPSPNNFRQARIIEGAEALSNPNGTAPGQIVPFSGNKRIILLPGPPRELIPMFEDQVLPRLIEQGLATPEPLSINIRTLGAGESEIAQLMEPFLAPLRPGLRVAYCATGGYVDMRLSANPDGPGKAELNRIAGDCKDRLGSAFLAYGYPDVACLILQQMRSVGKSIAVAESCTGGLLASRFTDIAGASKTFKGGVVCYNNAVKEDILGVPASILEQHGAVSAETAVAMATAVAEMMESDYGLAITGYAGPEGGREPAGTVYLGYHSPIGVWSRRAVLPGNRMHVKERAVMASLDFIRRKLAKYHIHDLLDSLCC